MIDKVTASDSESEDMLDVSRFCDDFKDAFDDTMEERELAQRCRDYYDGRQLTDEEIATLRRRKQPIVISNRIAPKINSLLGAEKNLRTDPKAYPRTPQSEADANSVTDALRFVCERAKFDDTRSDVACDLFVEGIGAAKVVVKSKQDDFEIQIKHVPWDRFYRDGHSRDRDFADAAFLGEVQWMDQSEALRLFPGKEDELEGCYSGETEDDTYNDRPHFKWGDRRRRRVRVMHHRFKNAGQWWFCVFCRGGFLVDPAVSPFVDEEGEPVCDLHATSGYIDRDNNRYGAVKIHLSPQDEINKRRSKALHLLNSRQIIADKGAVDDVQKTRMEAAKPDGFIVKNPGKQLEITQQADMVSGQFQLLQESKQEIDISGINPAIGGDQQAPSGRAQELLAQAGLSEQSVLFEALKHWNWEIYRQVWYRIRQYWTDEKWIRVTDDLRNLRWVPLNKPMTMGEMMMEKWQTEGRQQGIPQPQIDPNDPAMQQIVGTKNSMPDLDVDIILEDAPPSITIESEQFQALIDLKKIDPSIPTDAIIEASSIRNKAQIVKAMQGNGVPPQVQQQIQQLQQQLQQAQQKLQQAEQQLQGNQTDQAKVALNHQIDLLKAQNASAQLELQRYEAETARIVALKPIPLMSVPNDWPVDGQTPGPLSRGSQTTPVHSPPGSAPSMANPNNQ